MAVRAVAGDPGDGVDEAVRRALRVPDLLCVLGPPGSGKAHVAAQIAGAAAARGERVLVAARSGAAVDEVLARLPDELIAIRAGVGAGPRTVADTAAGLQRRVLSRSQATVRSLEPWLGDPAPAQGWLRRLTTALAEAEQARAAGAAARAERGSAAAAARAEFGGPLHEAERARDDAERAAAGAAAEVERLTTELYQAEARSRGVAGLLHRWRAGRVRDRLAAAAPVAERTRIVLAQARQEYAHRGARLDDEVRRSGPVRRAADRVSAADAAARRALESAARSAGQLSRLLDGVSPLPEYPAGLHDPARDPARLYDPGWLVRFAEHCGALEQVLRRRAALLRDWRHRLARPSEQLHAELLRHADVIGATCAGVGRPEYGVAGLEFDLAVVDGQASIAEALASMVRARRVVLVGDHRQPPPFAAGEVAPWPAGVRRLLTRSVIEHAAARAPLANQVLLHRLRGRPAVLGAFVSAHFYQGRPAVGDRACEGPLLLGSPLAIIDTSGLPTRERAERSRERSEIWQAGGFDNPAEARLVAELVRRCAEHGRDWLAVSAYRAQAHLIELRLRGLLGDTAVRDRVGTLDGFGDRTAGVVLCSLTRSNPAGRVGLLGEPRRLNAVLCRAREQLILVGDRETLTGCGDPGLRRLAGALFRYADRHGVVVAARDLPDRLR